MSLNEFLHTLHKLHLDPDQRREILLFIAKDSTGEVHQQTFAMSIYIHSKDQDANREMAREICEPIFQDSQCDPTRQLYALQRLVELDPVAEMLCYLQNLCNSLYEQYLLNPSERALQIYAAAKKASSCFEKDDVEALSRMLDTHTIEDFAQGFKRPRRQIGFRAHLSARCLRV